MGKENLLQTVGAITNEGSSPVDREDSETYPASCHSSDNEAGLATCRVCHCAESDKRGDVVMGFLGITPPLRDAHASSKDMMPNFEKVLKEAESDGSSNKNARRPYGFVEFVSPKGEVFLCQTDMEMGFNHQDTLIELGCSCKNDLALVHYACALKWFVNRGSTVCEICGRVAKNIRTTDFKKVVVSLKNYKVLRERAVIGEINPPQVQITSGVDPDAVAAIQRQRLCEISSWFNPCDINNPPIASLVATEEPSNIFIEEVVPTENPATKWAAEGTGILLATGLLTVTLAWLIAPRVGKKTAKSGLHILLGGICALTVVLFFRFIVLTRIKYGPARYWAILFVLWFLVLGIWASRTHGAHTA